MAIFSVCMQLHLVRRLSLVQVYWLVSQISRQCCAFRRLHHQAIEPQAIDPLELGQEFQDFGGTIIGAGVGAGAATV